MEQVDLYEVLGVTREATQEEIRSAYLRRAFQLHPDRNRDDPNATEKFQQLGQAYEILKDSNKRQIYDSSGDTMTAESGMQMEMSGEDLIGLLMQIAGFGASTAPPSGPKVYPSMRLLKVPMEVAYTGGVVKKTVKLHVVCSVCRGTGTNNGVEYDICSDCHGAGTLSPGGVFRLIDGCKTCNRVGHMIPKENICRNCKGRKVVTVRKKIEIPIQVGMGQVEEIVMNNAGNEYPGKEPADLIFIAYSGFSFRFMRDGDDLFYTHNVSLLEMEIGTSFVIKTLDGRELKVHTPKDKPILMDRLCMIPGEGFPCKGNTVVKGNLYIRFSPPTFGKLAVAITPFMEIGRGIASFIRSKSTEIELSYLDEATCREIQGRLLQRSEQAQREQEEMLSTLESNVEEE